MRILFATSPIGLGHASRDLALALALKRGWGAEVSFASGGGASRLIRDHGFEAHDLLVPPVFRVRKGRVVNWTSFLLRYAAYMGRAREAFGSLLKRCPWDLVIADEEFTSGPLAAEWGIPWVLVTDFTAIATRGTLAGPLGRFLSRRLARTLDAAPLVVIPGHGTDSANRRHVGPLVRPFSADRETLRRRHRYEGRTLLATSGGTPHGRFLLDAIADLRAREALAVDLLVVVGPLSRPPLGLRQPSYAPNLQDHILAADVVVTLAGRSTLDEARAAGTPCIALPLGNHFEQEANARAADIPISEVAELQRAISRAVEAPRHDARVPPVTKALGALQEVVETWPTHWAHR